MKLLLSFQSHATKGNTPVGVLAKKKCTVLKCKYGYLFSQVYGMLVVMALSNVTYLFKKKVKFSYLKM